MIIRFFFTVAIILEYIRSYFIDIHCHISPRRPARLGASEKPTDAVSNQRSEQRLLRGWIGLIPLGNAAAKHLLRVETSWQK